MSLSQVDKSGKQPKGIRDDGQRRKSQIYFNGALAAANIARQESSDTVAFTPEEILFLMERFSVKPGGWNIKSIPYGGGVALIIAKLKTARPNADKTLSAQIAVDILTKSGYRLHHDSESALFLVYPSKKALAILLATIVGLGKVAELLHIFLA